MIPSENARSDLRTFWQAILIFLMLSIVVGCSDDDEAPVTAVLRPQVTVLFSPNALGDNGYNDRIYTGLVRARVSRDLNLEILVPNSNAEADSMLVEWLDGYTAGTTPRLLVFASDEYEALARRYAARLPQTAKDRTLLFESTATDLPVATFAMPAYGACYRAGLLTAIWDEQPPASSSLPTTTAPSCARRGRPLPTVSRRSGACVPTVARWPTTSLATTWPTVCNAWLKGGTAATTLSSPSSAAASAD